MSKQTTSAPTEPGLTPIQLDRAVGAVVASAAGDALGSAYEFGNGLSDDQLPEFGVGVFGHRRGEWTDDTSMAIPILEAAARGASLRDPGVLAGIVTTWLEWSATAKDVGLQTQGVLTTLSAAPTEAEARAAARALHERSGRSAGNGSLMRTGPVALAYLADGAEDQLVDAAARIAQLTHFEQDNVDAVVLWSLAVRHAIRTGDLNPRAGLPWIAAEHRRRWQQLIDEATAPARHPREFAAQNGWVVKAFQAALAAVAGATDVRDALYRCVRGGGDTDTVAAIAGSLAGAVWGATQVPLGWQRLLHGWPGHTANDLTRLAVLAASGGRADNLGWPSAPLAPSDHLLHTPPRQHPHDDGVWLGSLRGLRELPAGVGAVVSLCRVGRDNIPADVESVRVWLVDQPDSNAHLDWTLADAADVIAELRSENKQVFVHCAEARSRTAAVAALYAVRHRGVPLRQAWRDVEGALPHFAPAAFHREAVARIVEAAGRRTAIEPVATAEQLARRAHEGQVDKAGLPYIDHPRRVAARVAELGGPPEAIAAAWLHDVVEDTATTLDDLRAAGFGERVVATVDALTRRPDEGEAYYRRVAAEELAVLVKQADIWDNTNPERLARLTTSDRDWLEHKYRHALAKIAEAGSTGTQGP